jgi:hypothetical protein
MMEKVLRRGYGTSVFGYPIRQGDTQRYSSGDFSGTTILLSCPGLDEFAFTSVKTEWEMPHPAKL